MQFANDFRLARTAFDKGLESYVIAGIHKGNVSLTVWLTLDVIYTPA